MKFSQITFTKTLTACHDLGLSETAMKGDQLVKQIGESIKETVHGACNTGTMLIASISLLNKPVFYSEVDRQPSPV